MIQHATISDMRHWREEQRHAGRRVGFVPTMGHLHEGHLSLVDRSRDLADATVLSVFVNPTQFGPGEDFDRYPRDLERDRGLAERRGVDCLFVPLVSEMYPRAASVALDPGSLGAHLCGPLRPGHFAGVMLVVLKLLHIVEPDIAVFGRKDAQQAIILGRMVDDLNLEVQLDVAPTVRESDGLALSSRNAYLTPDERRAAAAIPRALDAGHRAYREGATEPETVVAAVRRELENEQLMRVEYIDAVDPETLAPARRVQDRTVLVLAARVGATRLIDNVVLGEGTASDVFLDG